MNSSRNVITPVYAIVGPWYPTQTKNKKTNISNHEENTRHHCLLTFFGGLTILILFMISLTIPLLVIQNLSYEKSSTTTINTISDTTTTTVTSNITTTTTATTTTVTFTSNKTTTISGTTTSDTTTSTNNIFTFRWNTTGITVAGQVNITSSTSYYLNGPMGITFDSSDTLYVADSNNNRIEEFFLNNPNGTTVAGASNGSYGITANRFNFPNDVALDSTGNFYVVDTNNDRVQLWSVNASTGITVAGTNGNTTGQLDFPSGIAFDRNTNSFYISDGNNNRVMRYTLNSTVATLIAGGNGQGKNNTQLFSPRGLYFDSSTNSLIIANYGAHNIVRWVIGDSNWTIVAGNINGSSGNGPNSLYYPWDVTLDHLGNVYVADRSNHRIQFYLSGQINGTTIAGIKSQSGNSSITLNRPLSIALDSQLNLYVADTFNNRIQKFLRY